MKKIIFFALIGAFVSNLALYSQKNTSSAQTVVKDSSLIYPESMTEQLSSLLHDWQLDFSSSDTPCKNGNNVFFPDSIYAKRLYSMPSEMELSYNHVVKSYIDMYAGRKRELVSYMLTLGEYYFPMFEEALDKQGLPLELKYLPVIESALNPVAVSRAGATGLWQFMLRTGKGYDLEVNSLVDERRDPYKATQAAVLFLRDLYKIYGDWNLVIAAYNCGPGNVNKAIARSGGKRDYWEIYYYLPSETRGYVPAFIAANYIMNHYVYHQICPASVYSSMSALDTVHVAEQIHFDQIAQSLDIPMGEIRRLNPQFKKDIIPGNHRPYALVLPTNKMFAFIDKKEEILNYKKSTYLTHRINTDQYLTESTTATSGHTANIYYRVRKGDNLSKIAKKNGVTIAQLKSWNRLRSSKIGVGKKLVVKKKKVVPPPTPERQETIVYNRPDSTTTPDSTIISGYLDEQIEKMEESQRHKDDSEQTDLTGSPVTRN
ncbi:transglycosylase SLT domain-containing protein [Limibacterium fermenti]|uniref:lytic transglycosylase domain-containing protein n=1 Tax=Limibacterium fermenti TaxID=3229863 RepID=UPI000E912C8E|nr:lytic transglycosylase [Porphyromonadaceae bacterium]